MRKQKISTWIIAVLLCSIYLAIFVVAKNNLAAVSAEIAASPVTIVIDAGHGGEDGGAVSVSGAKESQINLAVSRRLEQLAALTGFSTYMIRSDDVAVYTGDCDTITEKKVSDLKNRVNIVNETENGLLVSIHQNTFSDGKYSGAQVFYAAEGESRVLAEQLQSTFCQTLNPGSNRRCKRADGVYLMEHIEKTGILVECGFLSNVQEEAKLRRSEYQKKLCCVIAATVCNFLDR